MQRRIFAQPFQAPIQIVSDTAKGLSELFADIPKLQTVEVKRLQRPALHVRQLGEGSLNMFPSETRLNLLFNIADLSSCDEIQTYFRVKTVAREIDFSIDSPADRNPQNPGFDAAS